MKTTIVYDGSTCVVRTTMTEDTFCECNVDELADAIAWSRQRAEWHIVCRSCRQRLFTKSQDARTNYTGWRYWAANRMVSLRHRRKSLVKGAPYAKRRQTEWREAAQYSLDRLNHRKRMCDPWVRWSEGVRVSQLKRMARERETNVQANPEAN